MSKFFVAFMLVCSTCFSQVTMNLSSLSCGTNTGILNYNSPTTISIWINQTGNGSGSVGQWVSKSGSNVGGFFRVYPTKQLEFQMYNLRVTTGNNAFLYNARTHLVVTWDGTKNASGVVFYANGSVVTSRTVTSSATSFIDNSSTTILIGNGYQGDISEVAIWNSVLTAEQITQLYKGYKGVPLQISPSTLVAYYPLDEVPTGVSASGYTFRNRKTGSNNCTGAATGKAENYLSYGE